jgi:hypothetical protein
MANERLFDAPWSFCRKIPGGARVWLLTWGGSLAMMRNVADRGEAAGDGRAF